MSDNIDEELNRFLNQNNLTYAEYNEILDNIELSELEIYLSYRNKYNLKIEDYVRLVDKWDKLTNKNDDFTFDLFIQLNKDRSYQSNLKIMNDITELIKSVESSEDQIKGYYEQNNTFKELKTTSTLTKFRKVIDDFMSNGKIPKEEDSFRQTILEDLLKSIKEIMDQKVTINQLSQESVTAIHSAKDLYCIWRFSDKTPKEVLESYKHGISPKSYSIVVSTFKDLIDRYPK